MAKHVFYTNHPQSILNHNRYGTWYHVTADSPSTKNSKQWQPPFRWTFPRGRLTLGTRILNENQKSQRRERGRGERESVGLGSGAQIFYTQKLGESRDFVKSRCWRRSFYASNDSTKVLGFFCRRRPPWTPPHALVFFLRSTSPIRIIDYPRKPSKS